MSSVLAGDVDAAIATVEGIGHSSGWDMLVGVMTALRVCSRRATCSASPCMGSLLSSVMLQQAPLSWGHPFVRP